MAVTHCLGIDSGGSPEWTSSPTGGAGAVDYVLVCTAATNVISWVDPFSFNSGGANGHRCLGIDSATDVISWSATLP